MRPNWQLCYNCHWGIQVGWCCQPLRLSLAVVGPTALWARLALPSIASGRCIEPLDVWVGDGLGA